MSEQASERASEEVRLSFSSLTLLHSAPPRPLLSSSFPLSPSLPIPPPPLTKPTTRPKTATVRTAKASKTKEKEGDKNVLNKNAKRPRTRSRTPSREVRARAKTERKTEKMALMKFCTSPRMELMREEREDVTLDIFWGSSIGVLEVR